MTVRVQARGLGRTFPGRTAPVIALAGVDLQLDGGQFVVVIGPSGCGKSTLLNLIGLLDVASEGTLSLEGIAIDSLEPKALAGIRRDLIGFLFQDAGLIARMSILDNVLLPSDYRDQPRGAAIADALTALETVGLGERPHQRVDILSGGERQRVGLARILAARPRIVVCDEPTASLDETNSQLVIDHLLALASAGALVVCASHDPLVIARAHLRIRMGRGRIKAIETAEAPV